MSDLIAELEGVVRLCERATPGPFVVDDYADVTANSEDVARIVTCEDDAQLIASAVNFLRTHHAEIAAAVRDSQRIDWLADPANKIGNVQLPSECVMANLHSLRAAIDSAMRAGEGEG